MLARMRIPFVIFIVLFVSSLTFGQTCKSNQYDMLDWMAPQQATLNGHYNMVYPGTGTFYWVKSSSGYPWDVDTFDSKYVYQSITEQVWNNPSTYKIFQTPIPWMPRCINVPAVPGKIASIPVNATRTWFDIHTSCSNFSQSIGTLPAAPTLTLSYRYGCDSQYSSCSYKETFALQKGKGMVQWTYYARENGQYVQVNQSTHGTVSLATVTPVHPCW
jgi:hypothetical protein